VTFCGRVDSTDHCYWCREKERARRCDDEDRENASRVTRDQVGGETNDEREWCEPDSVAIGEALQRRLACLCRANELDDSRVLALARGCKCLDLEWAFLVEAPTHHTRSAFRGYRKRLAREFCNIDM
jgi:hypothetical protein